MGILETFSKRKKRLEQAGTQDVYQYDSIPVPFRIQVIHIWRSALGAYFESTGYSSGPESPANNLWRGIHDAIARENGVFVLGDSGSRPNVRCEQYLMTADVLGALDIIELSFRVIDQGVRDMYPHVLQDARITQGADDAIEELNARFLERCLGYQYLDGIIVRLDSQFSHSEIVKPALSLLNESGFDGPTEEFMRAFEHYRNGLHKEAMSEALKAFESTMKAICSARKWPYPANATAKPLSDILFKNGLIPPDLESHFAGLRSAMESGLPTISNKTSRHGQGLTPVSIPSHFASYALHLAASNIVFLVQAHKAMK